MFRYGENKILEILTAWNTRFFPIALSLLSRMSIEPLMHSECLVCTYFQGSLALSGISARERVDTQSIAFNTNILHGWR